MTSDKFNDSLNTLLEEGRIFHVIKVLRSNCEAALPSHPDLRIVTSGLDSVSSLYSYMREFFIAGNPDPARSQLYEDIKGQLRQLGRLYLFIINEDRLDPLFAEYRLQKVRQTPVANLVSEYMKTIYRMDMALETGADPLPFLRRKETVLESIFRKIWSLRPLATNDQKAIEEIMAKQEAPFELKSQIVSALLLGLLKFNDPGKFVLLLKAYDEASEDRLAARILTAIVLVLARWRKSAVATKEIAGLLDTLADSILTYTRLREVVMTLIRTHDTDRVSREVKDAFNTTMREISPEVLEKLQREGMAIDAGDTGMNPEWEKLMKNKELEEKMQAINEMQLEGMDVMMQTFARLKSFPFFRSVANWFLPFSVDNSEVAPLFKVFDKEGFRVMADATEMCGGDRFSFVMGLLQMPEEKRNMLATGIGASLEQLKDHVKDRGNVRRKSEFASEALSFARDIYRFAKLFPRHKDFYDPFETPIDFLNLPVLSSLMTEEEVINKAADFYFQHGYYPLSLSLYEKAVASGEADRELYEKLGYSYQMTGDYASALSNYEKADLFSSDADRSSSWLLKKLALCYKALGYYEKSADTYRKLLERTPEDLNIEFHLGSVLIRTGNLKEGRELISKVHYLAPEHKNCEKLYTRLKAHDAFREGRIAEAAELYARARGEQNSARYCKDVIKEILTLWPETDTEPLKILLDSED